MIFDVCKYIFRDKIKMQIKDLSNVKFNNKGINCMSFILLFKKVTKGLFHKVDPDK